MNAIKTYYDDLPEIITIPKELAHRKAELIIIFEDDIPQNNVLRLKDFFGAIPDFPERSPQGN